MTKHSLDVPRTTELEPDTTTDASDGFCRRLASDKAFLVEYLHNLRKERRKFLDELIERMRITQEQCLKMARRHNGQTDQLDLEFAEAQQNMSSLVREISENFSNSLALLKEMYNQFSYPQPMESRSKQ